MLSDVNESINEFMGSFILLWKYCNTTALLYIMIKFIFTMHYTGQEGIEFMNVDMKITVSICLYYRSFERCAQSAVYTTRSILQWCKLHRTSWNGSQWDTKSYHRSHTWLLAKLCEQGILPFLNRVSIIYINKGYVHVCIYNTGWST